MPWAGFRKTAPGDFFGSKSLELSAVALIPLLKHYNRRLTIILVSAYGSLPLDCKLRRAGIFYQASGPVDGEDKEEIRKADQGGFEHSSTLVP
jgi:hypothetical protein